MKISDIKIGERHRKDLGDVKALAENIKHLGGLILPIVVSPDGLLLAGEPACRLQASRLERDSGND